MSRTQKNSESDNPATKFIKLSGSTGKFGYWDKEAENDKGEKGKTMELEYPIIFLPLDVLVTIKGFNKKDDSGIYSNEVHNIKTETLNVRIFGHDEIATGLYANIKSVVKEAGGKFANSVYGMMYDEDDNPEIVNFQFYGASLSPFIEYQKEMGENGIYGSAISIVGVAPAKIGIISYYIPTFTSKEVSKESSDKANEKDKELQVYLKRYKTGELEPKDEEEKSDEKPAEDEKKPDVKEIPF